MTKRHGRERRRFIKRRREQRKKKPIFGRYSLGRIKDKVVEIKYDDKLYTGKVVRQWTGVWHPNYRYSALVIRTPEKEELFYFCHDSKFHAYHGQHGLEWRREYEGKKPAKARIVRVLPKVDEILFKIEHTM